MAQSKTKPEAAGTPEPSGLEETIAYLAKRHKVSQAIVREIARKLDSSDRIAIERDIERGKARR